MKTFAYPEIYKEIAADNLGVMFDYGINFCNIDADALFALFVQSGCASQFENGSPRVLLGMSGIELLNDILIQTFNNNANAEYPISMYRSPEYWAGWILSQYQWYSCQSFQTICSCIKMSDLVSLYSPLHEAHEFKTFNVIDKKLLENGISLYNSIDKNGEIVNVKPYIINPTTIHDHIPDQKER